MGIINHIKIDDNIAVVDYNYMRFLKSKMLLATVIYYFENYSDILSSVGLNFDRHFFYKSFPLYWKKGETKFNFKKFWKIG
jgi:hypothetical protein